MRIHPSNLFSLYRDTSTQLDSIGISRYKALPFPPNITAEDTWQQFFDILSATSSKGIKERSQKLQYCYSSQKKDNIHNISDSPPHHFFKLILHLFA